MHPLTRNDTYVKKYKGYLNFLQTSCNIFSFAMLKQRHICFGNTAQHIILIDTWMQKRNLTSILLMLSTWKLLQFFNRNFSKKCVLRLLIWLLSLILK